LVVAAPSVLRAQAPEASRNSQLPTPNAQEPISVDVAVTARSGEVPALAAGAFTVTVSGTPREVVAAAPARADAAAGRTIYLAIDEGSVFKGAEASLRQAASGIADRAAPGDRLGVVLLPSSKPAQAPTDDAAAIERTLAGVTGRRPNDFANFGMGVGEALAIAESDSFALTAIADKECQAPPALAPLASSPVVPATQTVRNTRRECVQMIARNVETMLGRVRPAGMEAYRALLDFVAALRETPGPKTIVVVTAGFAVPLDAGVFDELAVRSALSEASVNAMLVEPVASGGTRRLVPASIVSERRSLMRRLTELTGSALGTAYSLVGTAVEPLDRLMTGRPTIYRLDVRPVAADAQTAGRLVVGVTGAGLTARARPYLVPPKTRPAAAASTPDARIGRALAGEAPTGDGLAIEAAGYLATLPGETAALLMAGEVHPPPTTGAADGEPPAVSIAYLLLDAKKQPVTKGPVPPSEPRKGAAATPSRTIAFTGNVDDLAPGTYTLRVAATDSAGRVGLVEREIVLRGAAGGGVTAGDVLMGRIEADDSVALAPGAVASGDTVFFQWDAVIPRGAGPSATLRIVDRTGATVLAIPAQVEVVEDKLRASAVLKPRLLPAGELEVVGEIAVGGKTAAERRRAFVVRGAGGTTGATAGGGVTLASVVPDVAPLAPRFTREAVLDSPLLGRALTALETRATSDTAKRAIARARAGDRSAPDPALTRADAVTGAFLTGLADLGAVNLAPDPAARATARADLERSAQRFREALRADADFLPAAVFLGACYALGGRDQEAAGAWQTALIGIDDEPALFTLIVDARLRAGDASGAAELLAEAERRWPADATLKPRRILVDLAQGRVSEALTALDTVERPSADMLFAAMRTLYGAHVAGLAVEDPSRDRARLGRYAKQYAAAGGADQALVNSWIAVFK
jgi:hypothetical protein